MLVAIRWSTTHVQLEHTRSGMLVQTALSEVERLWRLGAQRRGPEQPAERSGLLLEPLTFGSYPFKLYAVQLEHSRWGMLVGVALSEVERLWR
ncbi:MAG TPA: hypothetical protein VGL94_03630, partial [Ktedonobacteraceae bacterium]